MKVKAIVKQGHGVASGKAKDPRYPNGTLKAQYQHFSQKGLDLSPYFLGTINLDIAPYFFKILKPKYFLENINWSTHIPPENFYFFDVSLHINKNSYNGLIYMPDPATKAEHFQNPTILEVILPKIEELNYGDTVIIEVDDKQIELKNSLKKPDHK
ncbi:hypothetical protein [Arenibacter echinorum]|uniref:Riboflavin kinase n=1 Tax=Arenibacter echinorum TaxID=440515 RepID=A0A327RNY3_9FLAO|nr:hypothetical protein [Arenibacter echinorum]RAJ15407.1 hypothetical protein LV92_00101 [Arenibacter echinorum]